MELPDAVEKAVTECIQEGILKEFLEKNRAEVVYMSIFEYDQERHLRQEREEAYESGKAAGRKECFEQGSQAAIRDLIRKMWKRGKSIQEIAEDLEEDETFVAGTVESIRKDYIESPNKKILKSHNGGCENESNNRSYWKRVEGSRILERYPRAPRKI